jgi:hypothetical protein
MLSDIDRSQLNDRNNDFPFHNPTTAATDCNVAQASEAVEIHSGVTLSADDVRTAGNTPHGPTGNVLARRTFAAQGMVPEVDYRMLAQVPIQTVRDLLAAGWHVTLYVMYGTMIDEAPGNVGSFTYRGAHAIGVTDWWRGKLGRMVHYHDPLADGRTRRVPGKGRYTYPKGVQAVKFSVVRDAAYGYTGAAGLVSGYAVMPKGEE